MTLQDRIENLYHFVYAPLDIDPVLGVTHPQTFESKPVKQSLGTKIWNFLGQATQPMTGNLIAAERLHLLSDKHDLVIREQSISNLVRTLTGVRKSKVTKIERLYDDDEIINSDRKEFEFAGRPSVIEAITGWRSGAPLSHKLGNVWDRIKFPVMLVWNICFGLGIRLPINIVKLVTEFIPGVIVALFESLAEWAITPAEKAIKPLYWAAKGLAGIFKIIGFVGGATTSPVTTARSLWYWANPPQEKNNWRRKFLGGALVALSMMVTASVYMVALPLLFNAAITVLGIGGLSAAATTAATWLLAHAPGLMAVVQSLGAAISASAALVGIHMAMTAAMTGVVSAIAVVAAGLGSVLSVVTDKANAFSASRNPLYAHVRASLEEQKKLNDGDLSSYLKIALEMDAERIKNFFSRPASYHPLDATASQPASPLLEPSAEPEATPLSDLAISDRTGNSSPTPTKTR